MTAAEAAISICACLSALVAVPVLSKPRRYHGLDLAALELELERRIAEEDEAPAANDNRRIA